MIEIRHRETGEAKTADPAGKSPTSGLTVKTSRTGNGHQAPAKPADRTRTLANEVPRRRRLHEPGEPESQELEKPKKATPVKTVKPAAKKAGGRK